MHLSFDVPPPSARKHACLCAERSTTLQFTAQSATCAKGYFVLANNKELPAATCTGDTVNVVLERDRQERTIEAPDEINKALSTNNNAQAT